MGVHPLQVDRLVKRRAGCCFLAMPSQSLVIAVRRRPYGDPVINNITFRPWE